MSLSCLFNSAVFVMKTSYKVNMVNETSTNHANLICSYNRFGICFVQTIYSKKNGYIFSPRVEHIYLTIDFLSCVSENHVNSDGRAVVLSVHQCSTIQSVP